VRAIVLLTLLSTPLLAQESAARDRRCTGGAIDSAWTSGAPVYRDCDVERPARQRSMPRPSFVAPSGVECAIAEVEFVVDSLGRVEVATARVVSTNAPEFAARVLAGLDRARYAPAQREGREVRQLVVARVVRESGRRPFVVSGNAAGGMPAPPAPPPREVCR
jgi:hypothetical protein